MDVLTSSDQFSSPPAKTRRQVAGSFASTASPAPECFDIFSGGEEDDVEEEEEESGGLIFELPPHLVPRSAAGGVSNEGDAEEWKVVATSAGGLCYYHKGRDEYSAEVPKELSSYLGEWHPKYIGVCYLNDKGEAETCYDERVFWYTPEMNVSLPTNPKSTKDIFQAALQSNLFFLKAYCAAGGDLEVCDPLGRSAFFYACASGSIESVAFLVQRGSNVNATDSDGCTPNFFACRYGHANVVQELIQLGVDLNAQNAQGDTAMHEAVAGNHLPCIEFLLNAGADVKRRNKSGATPLDVAVQCGHVGGARLLVATGGRSVLSSAASSDSGDDTESCSDRSDDEDESSGSSHDHHERTCRPLSRLLSIFFRPPQSRRPSQ